MSQSQLEGSGVDRRGELQASTRFTVVFGYRAAGLTVVATHDDGGTMQWVYNYSKKKRNQKVATIADALVWDFPA